MNEVVITKPDPALEELLIKHCPAWDDSVRGRIHEFHGRLKAENEVQNLTRLSDGPDFFWGHVWDVWHLHQLVGQSGAIEFPAMDLGSGGGVPGLLSAVIRPDEWVLVDSEKSKAEFLSRTASEMGLNNVTTYGDRAENVLKRVRVSSIAIRAVGPLSRIWAWIGNCSTWNNLILFKGPAWEEEWAAFSRDYPRARVSIVSELNYTAQSKEGPRSRRILKLVRNK